MILPPELEWPIWMLVARRELGVSEYPGPAVNPRIAGYFRATALGGQPDDDTTPWCAAFVGWVLAQSAYAPSGRANARSYLHWGEQLAEPRFGAIAVLWRGTPDGAGGHVGFCCGDANTKTIWLLSGNQDNGVSYKAYPRARIIGYRWPLESDRCKHQPPPPPP